MNNNDELEQKKKKKEELEKELKEKKLEKIELDKEGKKEVEKQEANARDKYRELKDFQKQVDDMEKEYEKIEDDLQEKEQIFEKLDQEVKEKSTEIKILENEEQQEHKLEEDLNNLIKEKQDENFDAQLKADDYQIDIDALTDQQNQKVEEEKQLTSDIKDEEKVENDETKKIQQLDKNLREAHSKKNRKFASGLFGSIMSGIAAIIAGDIQAIIASIGGLIDGLTSASSMDELIAQIEQELHTSRRNLDQAKMKKRQFIDQRETARFEISRLTGERSNLLQLKAACFETIDQINDRIAACQGNAQEKKNQQGIIQNELKEKQTSLGTAMQTYNDIKTLRDSKLGTLTTLSASISAGQSSLANIANDAQNFLYKSVKIAADAKTAVNQVTGQINLIQSQINQLNIPKVAASNKTKI